MFKKNRAWCCTVLLSSLFLCGGKVLTSTSASNQGNESGKSITIYFGGEVGEQHPYAQHVKALLASLGIPFTSKPLQSAELQSDICQNKLVVITDLGALLRISPDVLSGFNARCKQHGSAWVVLYAGLQSGDINGLKVGRLNGVATHSDIITTIMRQSIVRVPSYEVERELPGNCRSLEAEKQYQWQVIARAKISGNIVPIVMMSNATEAPMPKTIVFGCDLFSSSTGDLLLMDLFLATRSGPNLDRLISIDIDDLFQPNWADTPEGRIVKIQEDDVRSLIELQKRWAEFFVDGFRFSLGFNAYWYEMQVGPIGTDDAGGDRAFVKYRNLFRWFDHFFAHEAATELDDSKLHETMRKNHLWAEQYSTSTLMGDYAISPAHLGILPIYEPLYKAWQDYGVRTTASFEIDSGGKAIRHEDIIIARRLSCGTACQSDQFSFSQVSPTVLNEQISRIVIPQILANPVLLFMSHQSGYARDRLATYVFHKSFAEVRRLTKLRFVNLPNEAMVRRYAEIFGVAEK